MMEGDTSVESLEDKVKEIEGENVCLQWTNHQHVLQSVMSALRNQEYFSDITLAAEGKFFHAHKFVLSTCSTFFEDLLGQTPCKHPVIVLPDSPPELLSKLLDFMYLGNTEVQKEDFNQFMIIARRLRIKGLLGPEDISIAEEEIQEIKEEISIKEEIFDSTYEELSFASEDFISESKFSEAYQEHIMDDTDFSGEVYKANDGRRRMYASPRAKKCPYCSKEFEDILQ
ncbi:unnamed protein product [Meganyctiphanes norvegica]|uniref:BTB domain-containing protein n=1 Tax=Meganyctiphanes norvegica TaxID=48144 RepID=A0AAV2RGY7_MEGNR